MQLAGVQLVLGVVAALLTAWIVLHLFGSRRYALAAGMVAALYGPALMYECTMLQESMVTFACLAAVASLIWAHRLRWRNSAALASGALFGLATIGRPTALLLAGGILILVSPGLMLDMGFQYSFLITAILILASGRFDRAAELLGETDAALLREPNNILGIEYCRALRGSGIGAVTLPRTGARHDGAASGGIASASEIRRLLHEGQPERAMAFLPPAAAEVLRREMAQGRAPVTLENCERAVLAKLRTLREEDFLPYDGGGEGLYRRVYRAVRAGTSVGEILALAKTKRYPMARLRRMLLAAWLEVPQPPEEVPYLRLLGAGKDGRPLLRQMQRSGVPVLTKPADVGRIGPAAQELFTRECAWTDLYMLGMPSLRWSACGSDWKTTPILL